MTKLAKDVNGVVYAVVDGGHLNRDVLVQAVDQARNQLQEAKKELEQYDSFVNSGNTKQEAPTLTPQPEQPQAEAVPVEAPQPGVDPEPKPAPEPESTEGPSITIS